MLEQWGLTVAAMLIGGLAGHWLGSQRQRERHLLEKRVEYAADFLGAAWHNLGQIQPGNSSYSAMTNTADFAILGKRIGLFVSDATADAIDALTTHYVRALRDVNDPSQPDGWKPFKTDLVDVERQIKRELRQRIH